MLKVVVDTNVLVSALLGSPAASALIGAFAAGRFRGVLSPALLAELTEVLARPRLRLDAHAVVEILELLTVRSQMVSPVVSLESCRDPKDNMLLECALAGSADVIVTGDTDLLILHPFRGIDILTPTQFLRRSL